MKELLSYYHVQKQVPDEDDPRNIQITEIEVEREVEGVGMFTGRCSCH
jgi:hypothetical protein